MHEKGQSGIAGPALFIAVSIIVMVFFIWLLK